jgi:hypothetical protein
MQKSFFSIVAAVSVILVAILGTSERACAAKAAERILHFPTDHSVGNLVVLQKLPESYGQCKGMPLAEARGVVRLPPGKLVRFEPNGAFFMHPECLLKLPRDAFDYIQLRFVSMTDQENDLSDRAIPFVGHLSSLKVINLDTSETSDKGLSQLPTMPELQSITASDSSVNGSCLHDLVGCKKLVALRLGKIQVSNESLRYLRDFPKLERLSLSRVNLSLSGLEHVSKCLEVKNLEIDGNRQIDDKALSLLLQMPKLTTLNIQGTKVSLQGIELLAKHGVTCIFLPRPFSAYSFKDQQRIKKAFPGQTFSIDRGRPVDSFTETMFAPMTRN